MGATVTVTTLWGREVRQLYRRPLRLISFFLQPLIMLFLFGFGLKRGLGVSVNGYDYVLFILPGIIGQRLLTNATRSGMSILRDRSAGFLKEVFVAPVSRAHILMGVTLGYVTRPLLEGVLLISVCTAFLGLRLGHTPWVIANKVAMLLILIVAIGAGLSMICIALAWLSEDPMTFGVAANWVILPLTLLSGTFYPIKNLPPWLAFFHYINPLSYAVDALRQVALGERAGTFPFWVDCLAIASFVVIGLTLGNFLLRRSSEKA